MDNTVIEHSLQRLRINGAAGIGRNDFDRRPRALRRQAHGGQIPAPLVTPDQDPLAGSPWS